MISKLNIPQGLFKSLEKERQGQSDPKLNSTTQVKKNRQEKKFTA